MNLFNRRLLRLPAVFMFAMVLFACQADISFDAEQKRDNQGNDYATLSWSIQPVNNIIPTKVELEPGFGEVEFIGSVDVFPTETTTYTLTVHAEYESGGIANTVLTKTVYVGTWVDYDLFTDSNLRECLESSGFTHVEQFENVICTDRNIESIQGIEQLTNAQVVSIDLNNISDFSPLAGLNNLHTLGLSSNNISDLSSLPTLPALKNLVLFSNNITDISPLAENPQVENLALNNNQIVDTQQFAPLTNLTSLTVANNQITDIAGLSVLTSLQVLDAKNNLLTDGVWELRTLTSAVVVDLRDNPEVSCLTYANLLFTLGSAVLFNDCSF